MKPIYLDYNATTPTDPIVVSAMLPYFTEEFGNPANTLNPYGWSAENAVKHAANQVAELINCKANEIVWNAGATEGNNTVVFGLIRKLRLSNPTEKLHFITSNAEHLSVINSFLAAKKYENIEVDFVPVNNMGIVDVEMLKKYIKPNTKLVSLIWVNNEIGAVNPIAELANYCHNQEIYFHTDATQAVGKVDVDLKKLPIHFLTFSAHKFYGPKGVGCLFIRAATPDVEILFGGGQQRNHRSGTLNVPAIVGTGMAAEIAKAKWRDEADKTRSFLKEIYSSLKQAIPELTLNGPSVEMRSPINLSLTFSKPIDLVLPQLSSLAFSQGSACSTGEVTSSHVLKAIGCSLQQSQNTIRLSLGRWTTQAEIKQAIETLIKVFKTN